MNAAWFHRPHRRTVVPNGLNSHTENSFWAEIELFWSKTSISEVFGQFSVTCEDFRFFINPLRPDRFSKIMKKIKGKLQLQNAAKS